MQVFPSRFLLVHKQDCHRITGKFGVCHGTYLVQPHHEGRTWLLCTLLLVFSSRVTIHPAGVSWYPEGVRGGKNK